jgi:cytochrome c biogenesis protein CcmG, thiol:disulfide interchange protein DsbE
MSMISKLVVMASLPLAALAFGCGGGGAEGPGATTGGAGEGSSKLTGNPGPDFSVSSVSGAKVSLAALQGKVVIVDFWATWCEPCKKSFPKLEELNVKYKGQLEIVAISEDDDKSGIPDFAKAHGGKFTLVWDDGKELAKKWEPKNMPTTFVLDKKGVVRFVHQGYHDGEAEEIDKEIKSLL